MMSSHTKLQYYRHNYGQVFMTGLLGCRWHRYKQNTAGSRKRDIAWLMVLTVTCLYTIFWFYFSLISQNDRHDFNWFFATVFHQWWTWFTLLLAVISVLFAYIIVLQVLSLCHVQYGHQVYIFPVHKCLIIVVLTVCIALTVSVEEKWYTQWNLLLVSLHMFGPFLQVGSVCLFSGLSWIFVKQWFRLTQPFAKAVTAVIFLGLMVSLYICPLFIQSPCVINAHQLPRRPALGAHRGAPALAPENTVVSFEIAAKYPQVEVLESDVHISYDGVPFLYHGSNLQSTTNVMDRFPSLAHLHPSQLNISQLQSLSAGSWFIKYDPWGRVGDLSPEEVSSYANQTLPTLAEVLSIAHKHNVSFMFDIFLPVNGHPYREQVVDIIVDTIDESNISKQKILWSAGEDSEAPDNYTMVYAGWGGLRELQRLNVSVINIGNEFFSQNELRFYQDQNISFSMYTVNTEWLYSFYWCLGLDLVYTDKCHILSQMDAPVWQMSPQGYLALWVTVDVLSVITVIAFVLIHRSRLSGSSCHVEQVSVGSHSNGSANMWRNKHTRRSMKEKLLMKEVGGEIYDFEPEEDVGIESTGYDLTVTASEGRLLSQAFHSNRNSYTSTATNVTLNRASSYNGSGYDAASVELPNYRNSFHSNRQSFHSNDGAPYQVEPEVLDTSNTSHGLPT